MSHPLDIIRLYSTILFNDIRRNSVSDYDMKAAIGDMQRVYKPDPGSLSSTARRLADYNSVAYRCAYLHKYAPFHTAMVCDIMRCILQQNGNMYVVFQKISTSNVESTQQRFRKRKKFKICSLGGGPGSDTVGVLVAMFDHFGFFPCSAKVIDIKSDWKDTLTSVIDGLSSGMCGPVGFGFTQWNFDWDFLTSDLLEEVHDGVKSAIGSADLVTMVKFVSAAACETTDLMLKKIFTMLKPGAVVLFIDNSSGGFRQLISKAATDCNLTSVCGPINYQAYTNEAFNITHWDYTSCYSTTVTVHMLQKLHPSSTSINTISTKIVHSASKSNNKRSDICSGMNGNGLPAPSSNGSTIKNTIPAAISNDKSLRKKLKTTKKSGQSLQNRLSTPSSNGNIIQKELLIASSCTNATQKVLPFSGNPIQSELPIANKHSIPIQNELPIANKHSIPIQSELPIANKHSIPIQNELASICKHDCTIRNDLPSGKHGIPTKTPVENRNAIQNKSNKFPIRVSTETECVPSTQRKVPSLTKVNILKETQNSGCLNLSSKTNNGYTCSSTDVSRAIVDCKSKIQKKENQSNQNDFTTINKDSLFVPITNDGICAAEVSKSKDTYNNDHCEESSSPNSSYVHNESSEHFRTDLKAHQSASNYVSCDVVLNVEVSQLEENVQKVESVGKLNSSVFEASTNSSQQAQPCSSPSNDTIFKCSPCCTIL